MKRVALLVPVVFVAVLVIILWGLSAAPAVKIDPSVTSIGLETPVKVNVSSPHGVADLSAYLEQNGKRWKVYGAQQPSHRFVFRGKEAPRDVSFAAGKKNAPELQAGKAKLIVEAKANDFRAAKASQSVDVSVNLQPPTVSADGAQHYINQGGSELVTFHVGGDWSEAGVRVGDHTFRSFPMPGQPENSADRFSLFAFPWDVPATTVPVVYVKNSAGTEATARFWFKVFPKKFRTRDLELNDQFVQKVVTELDPNGQGSSVDRFVRVNREMRKVNNQQLSDLRSKSEEKILWQGPFYRLGKVESFFADQRTYIYGGKKIDQQMHLGFDLSDVQGAPVKAANSGRVIHAGPLGIYGNCIVLDHGYGLQSIYGHLRQIDVKVDDRVQKVQVMGKSGATGMAGGDHLHYSMQVDGVQVQPIEWWDEHWIKDRILSKIAPQSK